jgi:hypothetical protein
VWVKKYGTDMSVLCRTSVPDVVNGRPEVQNLLGRQIKNGLSARVMYHAHPFNLVYWKDMWKEIIMKLL